MTFSERNGVALENHYPCPLIKCVHTMSQPKYSVCSNGPFPLYISSDSKLDGYQFTRSKHAKSDGILAELFYELINSSFWIAAINLELSIV